MAVRNGKPDDVLGELYPFEDKVVELPDGHAMHYIEAGRAGLRRPTFLLVHGHPTWSLVFRRLMEPLAAVGRVVAVDLVGFGRSDHPVDPDYYTIEQHVRNLEALAASLKLKRVVPVLHGWGAAVGLGYATRHPDALQALVVLNAPALETRPAAAPVRAARATLAKIVAKRRQVPVERVIEKSLRTDATRTLMEAYRHPFPTPESCVGASQMAALDKAGSASEEGATLARIAADLAGLRVPALIVWGSDDHIVDGDAVGWWHEALPVAQPPVHVVGAGHFVQEDEPDSVADTIVDWIRSL